MVAFAKILAFMIANIFLNKAIFIIFALRVEGVLVNYEIKQNARAHTHTYSITCTRIHTHDANTHT